MLALDLRDHQPLLYAMSTNWHENMTVQDWMDHFNPKYKIIMFLQNFEEVIEVLRFKIKHPDQGHRKSNRNKKKNRKIETKVSIPLWHRYNGRMNEKPIYNK